MATSKTARRQSARKNTGNIVYYKIEGNKRVFARACFCHSELDELLRKKALEYVSKDMENHEHLADVGTTHSMVLWFPDPELGENMLDFYYINNCPFCGKRFTFRRSSSSGEAGGN